MGGCVAHGHHFCHDFCHADVAVRDLHVHLWQGLYLLILCGDPWARQIVLKGRWDAVMFFPVRNLCVIFPLFWLSCDLWGEQPKHPRHDAWDQAMDVRDARLKEEYEKSQVSVRFVFPVMALFLDCFFRCACGWRFYPSVWLFYDKSIPCWDLLFLVLLKKNATGL